MKSFILLKVMKMNLITFIDTEINPVNKRILDIGAVKDNGAEFHSAYIRDFIEFYGVQSTYAVTTY